jgi:hypothetical protein
MVLAVDMDMYNTVLPLDRTPGLGYRDSECNALTVPTILVGLNLGRQARWETQVS